MMRSRKSQATINVLKQRPSANTVSLAPVIVYSVAAILTLAGLADATYLTVQFLSGETAVCGGSADCFRVLGSAYARLGPVPVAGLGLLAYFAAFSLATFAAFGYAAARRFFPLLIW